MSIAVYSAQQTQQLFELFSAMTDYYAGDPARINHFVKVHTYAWQIGLAEQLDADTLFLLEAAALTHDIGIREAPVRAVRRQAARAPRPARSPEDAGFARLRAGCDGTGMLPDCAPPHA